MEFTNYQTSKIIVKLTDSFTQNLKINLINLTYEI